MKLFLFIGFLGSGKTTLILSLAERLVRERGQKIGIIVNEVGTIGIDDKVMRKVGLDVWELYSGCICCQLGVDLVTTLHTVASEYRPDTVIVEASGLATPSGILDSLRYYRGEPLEKVRIVVVVDPTRLEMLMEVLTPLATAQIGAADILALNKIDECAEDEIAGAQETLRSLNGRATLVSISAKNAVNIEPILEDMVS